MSVTPTLADMAQPYTTINYEHGMDNNGCIIK